MLRQLGRRIPRGTPGRKSVGYAARQGENRRVANPAFGAAAKTDFASAHD